MRKSAGRTMFWSVAETKLILNLTRDATLCERVVVADRPLRRMRGLLGRRALPSGEGLLLRPAPAIHTAFMRFEIDAVFLDSDLRVVRVVEGLRPWRAAGKRGAGAVLELPAGECARRPVALGDQLALVDGQAAGDLPADTGAPRDLAADTSAPRPHALAAEDVEPSAAPVPGQARSEHGEHGPPSVLVVSHDQRFRTVSSVLLGRRGCSVATASNAGRSAEAAKRECAGVVVLDGDDFHGLVARAIAAVEGLTPPVAVVVVAQDASREICGRRALAKWGPFEDLFAAIQAAGNGRSEGEREA
jgi:uncharacterized membrane protein (UPF0127 family)/CheY-like chemotaxis protein